MTAVIILIVLVGLLWLVGQGVLLAMLWGQQQRLLVRLDHLPRSAGLARKPATYHPPAVPRLTDAPAPKRAETSRQPRTDERAAVREPTDDAPQQDPVPIDLLTFPPPVRKQSPVPPAREPLPAAESTAASYSDRVKPGSIDADRIPRDDAVHVGSRSEAPERIDRAHGLSPGSLLPDFELPLLNGAWFTRSMLEGKRFVLLFLAVGCPGSTAVLESVRSPHVRKRTLPDLVLVIDGGVEPETRRTWLDRLPKRVTVLTQEETELAAVLQVPGTPAAYVLDDALQTRGGLRTGARAVLEAMGIAASQMTATARRSTRVTPHQLVSQRSFHGLHVGEQAPELSLPLVGGGMWESSNGRPKLLIFWDTSCPPCDAMSEALIEAAPGWIGFDAVLISRGPVPRGDEIDRIRNHIPVAQQQGFDVAQQFQLLEAPAAIALTSDGTIARPPAIGASAILALAEELQERADRTSSPRQEPTSP